MTAIGPGTRVECIIEGGIWPYLDKTSFWRNLFRRPDGPVRGSKWTVSSTFDYEGMTFLVLKEWRNGNGFDATGFRPLDEPSIEVFQEILRKLPKRRKVSA